MNYGKKIIVLSIFIINIVATSNEKTSNDKIQPNVIQADKYFGVSLITSNPSENPISAPSTNEQNIAKDIKPIKILLSNNNEKGKSNSAKSGITMTQDTNPLQISVIISNGNDQKQKDQQNTGDPKNASSLSEVKPKQASSLGDILLKPASSTARNEFKEEDISSLYKMSSDIRNMSSKLQKMSETIGKILKKSGHYQGAEEMKVHENLVNYHVIEITENKNNK